MLVMEEVLKMALEVELGGGRSGSWNRRKRPEMAEMEALLPVREGFLLMIQENMVEQEKIVET